MQLSDLIEQSNSSQIFDTFYRNFLIWLRNNDDVLEVVFIHFGLVRRGWG